MAKVLVTGGSGFVGGHAIIELIKAGYEVHTTIRDLKLKEEILSTLKASGIDPSQNLKFFIADLTKDDGWENAVHECDYVLHVASPFPGGPVKDENEIINPARDGTLRVLKAARDAGVKRVVLTSSFAAVGYGYPEKDRTFSELDWTDIKAKLPPYIKSKTIAEKAAWDFVKGDGADLELTTICPTGIFGPPLSSDLSSSIEIVLSMLKGKMPICPKIYFGIADVRDVVSIHILAMTHPKAGGERFIATSGGIFSMFDVSKMLRKNLGARANGAPRWEPPNWAVRVMARFAPKVRELLPNLGVKRRPLNEKALDILGWKPRPAEETITATGEGLIKLGFLESSS